MILAGALRPVLGRRGATIAAPNLPSLLHIKPESSNIIP